MIRLRLLAACLLAVLLSGHSVRAQCPRWMHSFGGATPFNAPVNATCAWRQPGAAAANGVNAEQVVVGTDTGELLIWNGQTWTSLASVPGSIRSLTVFNGDLIVGGQFTAIPGVAGTANLARWDGAWHALGSLNGAVNAMVVMNFPAPVAPRLAVGGSFTSISGLSTSVGCWDGTQWTRVNTPISNATIRALTYNRDQPDLLYAAGNSTASGACVWQASIFTSSSWTTLATTFGNGQVTCAEYYDHSLFVGGSITSLNSTPVQSVARMTAPGTWVTMQQVTGSPRAMILDSGLVVSGEVFTQSGLFTVVRWTEPPNSGGAGGSWTTTGFTSNVTRAAAMAMANGELIVAAAETGVGYLVLRWSESGIPWVCSQTAGPISFCGAVSLTALSASEYNATYQWVDDHGALGPPRYSGNNGPVLSGTLTNSNGPVNPRCLISTPGCGGVSSTPVNVTTYYPPTFLATNLNHTVCPGSSVQLLADSIHETFMTFHWQALLSTGWTDLTDNGTGNACGDVLGSGGFYMILTDGPAGSSCNGEKLYADGRQFRCVANGPPCATTISPVHTLHLVTDPPIFSLQPVEQAVCSGGTVIYTVAVSRTSGTPITLQWQYYEPGLTAWIPPPPSPFCGTYTGGDTTTFTITDTGPVVCGSPMFINGRRYRCLATSDCFAVASNEIVLWVDPADIGQQGGLPGSDGQHDNNDFIAFINLFFAADPLADMGKQGGVLGHDGAWDNNDFIVFISRFFDQCP